MQGKGGQKCIVSTIGLRGLRYETGRSEVYHRNGEALAFYSRNSHIVIRQPSVFGLGCYSSTEPLLRLIRICLRIKECIWALTVRSDLYPARGSQTHVPGH
jgi:hypothetical protein